MVYECETRYHQVIQLVSPKLFELLTLVKHISFRVIANVRSLEFFPGTAGGRGGGGGHVPFNIVEELVRKKKCLVSP